jgi:hypothetical protein
MKENQKINTEKYDLIRAITSVAGKKENPRLFEEILMQCQTSILRKELSRYRSSKIKANHQKVG